MDEKEIDVKVVPIECTNDACDGSFIYSEDEIKEELGIVTCNKCGQQMQIVNKKNYDKH